VVLANSENLLHSPLSGLQFVPELWSRQIAIEIGLIMKKN